VFIVGRSRRALHDSLRRTFADDDFVQVVLDRRVAERRRRRARPRKTERRQGERRAQREIDKQLRARAYAVVGVQTIPAALATLTLALLLLAASPGRAQDVPPEARDLAQLAGKIGSQVVRANLEGRLQRQLSPGEATQLIARHFSRDEMRDLAAFYRTPLGAKALRLSVVPSSRGSSRPSPVRSSASNSGRIGGRSR
jgi:hypothetical protein